MLFYSKDEHRFSKLANTLFAISVFSMTILVAKFDGSKILFLSTSLALIFKVYFVFFGKIQDYIFIDFKLAIFIASIFCCTHNTILKIVV